jgi:hypothetical protein
MAEQLYVYRWRLRNPRLGGQVCRVLARGALNTALVQFADGERVVISRNALRKAK